MIRNSPLSSPLFGCGLLFCSENVKDLLDFFRKPLPGVFDFLSEVFRELYLLIIFLSKKNTRKII